MNSDTYILPREGQFGNAKVEEGGVAVSLVALADSQRASDFRSTIASESNGWHGERSEPCHPLLERATS